MPDAAAAPIFVVGMQRSGTTLMRALLSAHPRITIAPETHLLELCGRAYLEHPSPGEPEFREFWTRYTAGFRFRDLGVSAEGVREAVLRAGDLSPAGVFRALLAEYARLRGKPRWGEKTPSHYGHIRRLLGWFPGARIVHMVRDPRATCASMLDTPWGSVDGQRDPADARLRTLFERSCEWRMLVGRYEREWKDDPRVLLVAYEELVQGTEAVMRRVCGFVGEDYDARMITSRTERDVPPPSEAVYGGRFSRWREEHLRRAREPVTDESVGRWRRQLSDAEVRVVEHVCRAGMRRHGYEPEAPRPPLGALGHAAVLLVRRARWRAERGGRSFGA